MAAAKVHGVVDVFDGADAFFERAHGGEEVGYEKAIDDESGAVVGAHRRFPELRAKRHPLFIHSRIGGDGSYDFDELHDWHGIKKMQSDDALRPLGGCGDFGDGQGRGVAGKDGGRRAEGVESAEKPALGGKLHDDGLEHYVAALQVLQRGCAFQPAANFIFLRFVDGGFLYLASEILVDASESFVHNFRADLAHDGGEAGLRGDLRDTRAHQATPYDANFLNRHSIPL